MSLQSLKILMVEDDNAFVKLTTELLKESRKARFSVVHAKSIAEGLLCLSKDRFDLVLLDFLLPDGDGRDFIRSCNDKLISVPVVVITGYSEEGIQQEVIALGAVDFMEKNVYTVDLLERTCIHAVGLHERIRSAKDPSMNMMERLVALERESVKVAVEQAKETAELRNDLRIGVDSILKAVEAHKVEMTRQNADKKAFEASNKQELITLIVEVRDGINHDHEEMLKGHKEESSREHEKIEQEIRFSRSVIINVLDWIPLHPWTALGIFVSLLATVVILALVLKIVDVQQLKTIKDLTGAKIGHLPVSFSWFG